MDNSESVITKSSLTETERRICLLLGAKYVSADYCGGNYVKLWNIEPYLWGLQYREPDCPWSEDVFGYQYASNNQSCIAMIERDIFQSLRSGDLVAVE